VDKLLFVTDNWANTAVYRGIAVHRATVYRESLWFDVCITDDDWLSSSATGIQRHWSLHHTRCNLLSSSRLSCGRSDASSRSSRTRMSSCKDGAHQIPSEFKKKRHYTHRSTLH